MGIIRPPGMAVRIPAGGGGLAGDAAVLGGRSRHAPAADFRLPVAAGNGAAGGGACRVSILKALP